MKNWKHYAAVFVVAALGMGCGHCSVLLYEDHVMVRALWAYANRGAQQKALPAPEPAPAASPGGK